jgi:hypothetical protein
VLALASRRICAAAFLVAATIPFVPPPADAAPTPGCVPACFWVDAVPGPGALREYAPDGTLIHSADLSDTYTDIALSADGSTLYGIDFARAGVLYPIDPDTGVEGAGLTITGPAASAHFNALTTMPDGTLLAGAASGPLFSIDPASGDSTRFRTDLPPGFDSSGDLFPLRDGDILAIGKDQTTLSGPDSLMRIHPDNTITTVGTLPKTFGAAVVGCRVFLAGADGVVRAIDAVPTKPSTRRLDYVRVAAPNVGPFLGATAPPTAARCAPVARPDRATTDVDTPVVVGVLGNDSAAAAYFPLDPTSVRLLDHGSPVRRLAVAGQGVFVSDDVTGKVTFTPADGFTGHVQTVGYRVLDSEDTLARSTIDVRVVGPGPRPGPGPGPGPDPDIPNHFPAGLSSTPGGSLSESRELNWLLGSALASSAAVLAAGVLAACRRTDR